jgi:parvulin-like peptidyl-prolyl isomerase
MKQASFGGDQAKFDEALKEQGITLEQVKQSYRESMLLQKTYDEVTKDVTTVPDTDIQAYYDGHKTDYFVDETRTARHILISPVAGRVDGTTSTTSTSSTTSATAGSSTGSSDSSTTTAASTVPPLPQQRPRPSRPTPINAARDRQQVRAELVAGADWTAEAAKYSTILARRQKGGDLAPYQRAMVKELKTRSSLQEG